MANEYLGNNYAAPQAQVGDEIEYLDFQDRKQSGKVLRIDAHFVDRDKLPLIIYVVTHPTYRNRIHNCIEGKLI